MRGTMIEHGGSSAGDVQAPGGVGGHVGAPHEDR
jgi:hypothetical protein